MKTILFACLLLSFHFQSTSQEWKKSAKDFTLYYSMTDIPVLKLSVPPEAFKDDDEDADNDAQNPQINNAASRFMKALSSIHRDQFHFESDKYEYGPLNVWCHTGFPLFISSSYDNLNSNDAKLYGYANHVKEQLEENDDYWIKNTFGDINEIENIKISKVDLINKVPVVMIEFDCYDNKKPSKIFFYGAYIPAKTEGQSREDEAVGTIIFHFDKTKSTPKAFSFAKDVISTIQYVK